MLEPLGQICVADSRFLGFCFEGILNENDAQQHQAALKEQYPDAAHVPVVWRVQNATTGVDEDGEPPIGKQLLEALLQNTDSSASIAVVIVRFFGNVFLGVTCGRLPQCYQSIIRLSLHRHDNRNNVVPMDYKILNVESSIYGLAAGDTELILDVVPEEGEQPHNKHDSSKPQLLVQKMLDELNFDGFKGAKGEVLPRLQNLQADLSDNKIIPVYRYPGNYQGDEWETFDWSPTSLQIKAAVEAQLLLPQTMNHCVTNYYRHGKDFIQHHSDKDLDLNRKGVIVSVSLGDERILELKRRADPKDVTQITLPHRSMLVLGPQTNQQFTHSILQKPESDKARVSLTLRECKTFKDLATGRLFGEGVQEKSLQEIQSQQFIEHSVIFGGFCALTAAMASKRMSPDGCMVLAALFATGTISFRLASKAWYKRRDEKEARAFFSKKSLTGTKY